MQRLGISEREFIFWGDARDAEIHELIFKLIHYQKEKPSTVSSLLKRLNNYSTENNVILQQYILFFNALQESNPITSIELMKKALFLTLPRFDIYKIHLFRLSWLELSIINNIALTYHLTDMPHIGITYFYQLINYFSIADPDSILLSNISTVTFSKLVQTLYREGRYREINELLSNNTYRILHHRVSALGIFLFYCSQAVCELKDYDFGTCLGTHTYYIEKLVKRPENANALQNYLFTDFSLTIP